LVRPTFVPWLGEFCETVTITKFGNATKQNTEDRQLQQRTKNNEKIKSSRQTTISLADFGACVQVAIAHLTIVGIRTSGYMVQSYKYALAVSASGAASKCDLVVIS